MDALPEWFHRYLRFDSGRVLLWNKDREIDVSEIKIGVFFVLYSVSLASRKAFLAPNQAVTTVSCPPRLKLIVVDNDGPLTERFRRSIGYATGGKGETFWISSGRVVHALENYTESSMERLRQYFSDIGCEHR